MVFHLFAPSLERAYTRDVDALRELLFRGSCDAISRYEYAMLRLVLLADPVVSWAVPQLIRDCSTLQQFESVAGDRFSSRLAREESLAEQFQPLIAWVQGGSVGRAYSNRQAA